MPDGMKIILAMLWLAGGVFFFFLTIYIGVSYLAGGIGRLFKRKGLYHFREEEFSALNIIHNSEKNIPIGKLPAAKGETFTYTVPIVAKEVLLEFKLTVYPHNSCIEFDYCLSANDSSLRKEFVYIFISPFDSMKLNYDRVLLWYPIPEDHVLKVQFTDVKSGVDALNNVEGYLNVVQVR
jgi:hypothetical protein